MTYLVFQYEKHYDCKIFMLQLKVPARTFKIGTPGIQDFDSGKVIVMGFVELELFPLPGE